jgi:hypothetical protein
LNGEMRSPGAEQPVAHVALLATGRSTLYEEEGRAFHRRAVALLRKLGAEVRGPGDLVEFAAQVPADFGPNRARLASFSARRSPTPLLPRRLLEKRGLRSCSEPFPAWMCATHTSSTTSVR